MLSNASFLSLLLFLAILLLDYRIENCLLSLLTTNWDIADPRLFWKFELLCNFYAIVYYCNDILFCEVALLNVQSTQCGFFVFHFATTDKVYLARTMRGTASKRLCWAFREIDSRGAVAVICGDRLSYVCIYKTNFSPHNGTIVSISSCFFHMIV